MSGNNSYHVIVIGGGPAGLSGALVLGRSRRKVMVIDAMRPRNRFSGAINGFITRDGIQPMVFLEKARKELQKYDVSFTEGQVAEVQKGDKGFIVTLEDKQVFSATMVLLASGLTDRLPEIKDIDQYYGTSVFHCPYCDGWELDKKPVCVYAERRKAAVDLCLNLRNWSDEVTLLAGYTERIGRKTTRKLEKRGIKIVWGKISGLKGKTGKLSSVTLENGDELFVSAIFFSTGTSQHSNIAAMLHCEFDRKGAIKCNKYQQATVKGLYVAGDMVKDMQLVVVAAAEGAKAGVMINKALNRRIA